MLAYEDQFPQVNVLSEILRFRFIDDLLREARVVIPVCSGPTLSNLSSRVASSSWSLG